MTFLAFVWRDMNGYFRDGVTCQYCRGLTDGVGSSVSVGHMCLPVSFGGNWRTPEGFLVLASSSHTMDMQLRKKETVRVETPNWFTYHHQDVRRWASTRNLFQQFEKKRIASALNAGRINQHGSVSPSLDKNPATHAPLSIAHMGGPLPKSTEHGYDPQSDWKQNALSHYARVDLTMCASVADKEEEVEVYLLFAIGTQEHKAEYRIVAHPGIHSQRARGYGNRRPIVQGEATAKLGKDKMLVYIGRQRIPLHRTSTHHASQFFDVRVTCLSSKCNFKSVSCFHLMCRPVRKEKLMEMAAEAVREQIDRGEEARRKDRVG
eukprot:GHVN01087379.1.p1 GENE.GHVN01087379.1~~GHVN01087379.1.p1  ORF type:complete len:320 (+),score=33.86 GHVN01087379.1:222-1181(+)